MRLMTKLHRGLLSLCAFALRVSRQIYQLSASRAGRGAEPVCPG